MQVDTYKRHKGASYELSFDFYFFTTLSIMKTAVILAVAGSVLGRTFTVYNACPFTIWPAIFTDLNVGTSVPSIENGWEAPAYSKRSFTVPDDWRAGRIWGRTQCDFSTNPGINSCLTGGCNGGLVCDNKTGVGLPPATFAEFTLGANAQDYTDVSLVDGFNLPMRISNTGGRSKGPWTPTALSLPARQVFYRAASSPTNSFQSACLAQISPPSNSPSCCTGDFQTPATCPPSGVEYYSYFKQRCPYSYVYAYDESSGTSLLTCPSSKKADYTVTFCP
ncbi:unnamed protein product [Rhizoctonia solani]|uniref:Thaumatin-like protein 1 n=1 Tax=Rhizoctonia solani TaxID=456999 RepID=A0A8H2XKS8_9AGAM|nr:unnamed protein product [Rhizoctonia solani]